MDELHIDSQEIPYGPADGEAVCGGAATAEAHAVGTQANQDGRMVYQWLEEAPYSPIRIPEKLKEQGLEGQYSIVKADAASKFGHSFFPYFTLRQLLSKSIAPQWMRGFLCVEHFNP